MSKLFLIGSRGVVLAGMFFLLAVSPTGNAQDDRSPPQTEPTETAKRVSKLTAALKDRSYWPDQYRAADALGKLGPEAKDAVPALAAALKDPVSYVRMAAARALGKVGCMSPEVWVALKAAAKDEDRYVRDEATEACESLIGRATRNDVPVLITALKESEPSIRRAAARALGKIDSVTPGALRALRSATKDESALVREAATEVCKSIRERLVSKASKEDVPVLIAALKETEPFIRRESAVRALGQVGSLSPEVLVALKAAAKDNEPDQLCRKPRGSDCYVTCLVFIVSTSLAKCGNGKMLKPTAWTVGWVGY